MAISWLTGELGANAKLRVLVQKTATPTYEDITDKVRADQGVNTRFGRSDESDSSQPASATMVVDNSTKLFTTGLESFIYPYNRVGSLVRVEVTLDSVTWLPVFVGTVAGFHPVWDETGDVQNVELECAGVMRRLLQGIDPQPSLMRRYFSNVHPTDIVAYWPLEENEGADSFAPADWHYSTLPTTMGILSGSPNLEACDDFVASDPLPNLNGAQFEAELPGQYATFGKYQLSFAVSVPSAGSDDLKPLVIMKMDRDSSMSVIEVNYLAGGGSGIEVRARNSTGGTTYASSVGIITNGNPGLLCLQLEQTGPTTVGVNIFYRNVNGGVGGAVLASMTSTVLGTVRMITVGSPTFHKEVGIGHVMLRMASFNAAADFANAVTGFKGEITYNRFARLCTENGIASSVAGATGWFMGPQRPDGLMDLLREIETLERGLVYDGTVSSLVLRGQDAFENQTASITLDMSSGHIAPPFEVTHDDQGRVNVAEAKDVNGSTEVVTQTQGNLKPSDVGTYSASESINRSPSSGLRVRDHAGWMVSLGTIEGYRYPSVTIDLRANPGFASAVLNMRPGNRIDITNLRSILPGHPPGTVKLTVQGVQHSIGTHSWVVTFNTTPFEPNHIFTVANPTGDTSEFLGRVDTDASTTASAVSVGATSISVASSGVILWTTDSDDLPLTIDIGGIPIRVTAISGTTSPQTFTVNGSDVIVAIPAGTKVQVWQPGRLRV